MTQIICRNAALGYDRKIFTSDLSFSVEEGDYLCVVGENGVGKSTLIKAILGLNAPIKGSIELCGIKKNEIGYLPQQTDVQRDFPASVEEIVLSGCLSSMGIRAFYGKKEKLAASESLDRLGILNLKKRCYRELSGGQQQRALLARAMVAAKKLLVLDEPAAGLDIVAAQEMYSIIKELNKKDLLTVIMVTHDINEAVKSAGKILHLGEKMLFFGSTKDYVGSNAEGAFLKRVAENTDV